MYTDFDSSNTPVVWVLNLDAEHELEAGIRYSPNQHMRAIVAREQVRLIFELLNPGDYLLRESANDGSTSAALELLRLPPSAEQVAHLVENERALAGFSVALACAQGLTGLAWSPTPRALAQLQSVGAIHRPAPTLDILRTVNARPFAATLRESFRGSSFEKHIVLDLDQAIAQLAQRSPNGWLVRRTFGAAGRGRRRIAAGTPTPAEIDWLTASLRRGPLVIEPWVLITREFTRSGSVESSGDVLISRPCLQKTTSSGAWLQTEHAATGEVSKLIDDQLQSAFEAAGRALALAGYNGPFGIDAYMHRTTDDRHEVLNPLSEINARFTMDWSYSTKP